MRRQQSDCEQSRGSSRLAGQTLAPSRRTLIAISTPAQKPRGSASKPGQQTWFFQASPGAAEVASSSRMSLQSHRREPKASSRVLDGSRAQAERALATDHAVDGVMPRHHRMAWMIDVVSEYFGAASRRTWSSSEGASPASDRRSFVGGTCDNHASSASSIFRRAAAVSQR